MKHDIKEGDLRVVERFAVLPTRLESGKWIWFKKYMAHQRYEWFYFTRERVISQGLITERVVTDLCKRLEWQTCKKTEFQPADEA